MIQDPYPLLVVFLGVILAAMVLEKRYAFARKLSPVLLILFLSALLSNTGIIMDRSTFYEDLIGFMVPFAVCLVLFTVQLKDLKHVGLPMLAAFAVACIGTFLGALVAGMTLNPYLNEILKGEAWKLAGPFTGTYTGGSLNFFALWAGLEIRNPDLLAAANAVDNLTLFPLFAIWIFVPDLLGRLFPVGRIWKGKEVLPGKEEPANRVTPFRMIHVTALCALALAVVHASEKINEHLIEAHLPRFPTILLVTTLALVLAQFRFIGKLEGAFELGNLAFYLFFCAVGAMIDLRKAVTLCPILFVYVMIMIAIHMFVVYGLGRLLRLDIKVLTIASAAAKAGPPCILALANVKGWKLLVLPGVAMGLLGYAVGNYLGFAAAYLMRFILGSG